MGRERSGQFILIRGGGDLASGIAWRLTRCGLRCLVTEIPRPTSVRRPVSFSSAVSTGSILIEGMRGVLVPGMEGVQAAWSRGEVPVLVDPDLQVLTERFPAALVDARMLKRSEPQLRYPWLRVIGIGPGFTAGFDCRAVVETNRGPGMGRVIREGPADQDTGVPEQVLEQSVSRVLRAPGDGKLENRVEIGAQVARGGLITSVSGNMVQAAFDGLVRGLLPDGFQVVAGMKIGDLDPRGLPELVWRISDKALAVAGGVLEALLSDPQLRGELLDGCEPDAP